jgi:hypothetical protein
MICQTEEKAKTGELIPVGHRMLGFASYDYYQCVDCGTEFPVVNGNIRCNSHHISVCPWCRPDSKPWANGRGE